MSVWPGSIFQVLTAVASGQVVDDAMIPRWVPSIHSTRIALLAEAQGHHPELEIGWGRLVVRLSTHAVGGLSRNDFIMAARIDRLVGD